MTPGPDSENAGFRKLSSFAQPDRRRDSPHIFPRPLANDEHFSHVVARQEELDRGEVAEEGFDVAVVEDPLQVEAIANRRVYSACGTPPRLPSQHDRLHLQDIFSNDVKAVAGRIWSSILRVKKRQHHSAWLQH